MAQDALHPFCFHYITVTSHHSVRSQHRTDTIRRVHLSPFHLTDLFNHIFLAPFGMAFTVGLCSMLIRQVHCCHVIPFGRWRRVLELGRAVAYRELLLVHPLPPRTTSFSMGHRALPKEAILKKKERAARGPDHFDHLIDTVIVMGARVDKE